MDNKVKLISLNKSRRVPLILDIVNKLAIINNNKTLLFSFNIRSEYYYRRLISHITGIDHKLITKYHYPYQQIGKCVYEKIDRDKYIGAIEAIQNSNLLMSSTKVFPEVDDLDYILDFDADYLIIDNIKDLLRRTKYNFDEVIKKLCESNKHIILFINDKGKKDETLNKFKNYKEIKIEYFDKKEDSYE